MMVQRTICHMVYFLIYCTKLIATVVSLKFSTTLKEHTFADSILIGKCRRFFPGSKKLDILWPITTFVSKRKHLVAIYTWLPNRDRTNPNLRLVNNMISFKPDRATHQIDTCLIYLRCRNEMTYNSVCNSEENVLSCAIWYKYESMHR